ncbi:hypothetical protein ACWIGW_41190 [Nocardia brasiliensis]
MSPTTSVVSTNYQHHRRAIRAGYGLRPTMTRDVWELYVPRGGTAAARGSLTELDRWLELRPSQPDPRWLAWCDGIADRAAQVVDTVLADIENPWSTDGLLAAERAALARFPISDALYDLEHRRFADNLATYLGEVFRRRFRGRWTNDPDPFQDIWGIGYAPVLALGHPGEIPVLEVHRLVLDAVTDRDGDTWAQIWTICRDPGSHPRHSSPIAAT